MSGAALNAFMLSREFQARGYASEAWFLYANASGIDANFKPDALLGGGEPRRGEWALLVARFMQLVVRRRPRAIFGFHPLANVLGALCAPLVGARFIASQRNPADSQTSMLAHLDGLLGATPLYRSNIAVSQAVADTYSSYSRSYVRKIRVIHNGTPALAMLPHGEGQVEARLRLNLPRDGIILGSIGRLASQKNIGFLIDLMPLLPEYHLALAGDGPDRAMLQAQADANAVSDRVLFLGPLTGVSITRFYVAIDAFVMPSRYEGFGRTIVESLSMGKPTFVSDLPVTREVSKGAAVCLPLDLGIWASALRSLHDSVAVEDGVAGALRRQVARDFTVERMVDGYLAAAGLPSSAVP